MGNYIVEYEIHWSDGCSSYENTVNVIASSLEEAKELGIQEIEEQIDGYNRNCAGNSYSFVRCVEEDNFSYISSAKEESSIYKDAGYIDVLKFNPLH